MAALPAPEELADVPLIRAAGNVLQRFVISCEDHIADERLTVLILHSELHGGFLLRQVFLFVGDELDRGDVLARRHDDLFRHTMHLGIAHGEGFDEKIGLIFFGHFESISGAFPIHLNPHGIGVDPIRRTHKERHARILAVGVDEHLHFVTRRVLVLLHGQLQVIKLQPLAVVQVLAAYGHKGDTFDLMSPFILEQGGDAILPGFVPFDSLSHFTFIVCFGLEVRHLFLHRLSICIRHPQHLDFPLGADLTAIERLGGQADAAVLS